LPWTHSRLQRSSLTHANLQKLTSTTKLYFAAGLLPVSPAGFVFRRPP
jgi:hypothetical protein